MERTAVVDLQAGSDSDGRSEVITLITLVLWTERAAVTVKAKRGRLSPL